MSEIDLTKDSVPLHQYLEVVEELTEALRLTAEYTGQGVLPASEGWTWFDALSKYAPQKAAPFTFYDRPESNIEALPYKVMVVDEQSQMVILEDALTNTMGLRVALIAFTELDQRGRSEFLRTLDQMGEGVCVGTTNEMKRYSISVVDRKRLPVDAQFQFNRIKDHK